MSLLVTTVLIVWLVCAVLVFIGFGIITVIHSLPNQSQPEARDSIPVTKTSPIA